MFYIEIVIFIEGALLGISIGLSMNSVNSTDITPSIPDDKCKYQGCKKRSGYGKFCYFHEDMGILD